MKISLPIIIYGILKVLDACKCNIILSVVVQLIEDHPEKYLYLVAEIKQHMLIALTFCSSKVSRTISMVSLHFCCNHWSSHATVVLIIYFVSASSLNSIKLLWAYMHLRPPTVLK